MALLFSRRAVRDLEDIGDYIAQANPRRAHSFVAELRQQCEKIAHAPLSYPAREDIAPRIARLPAWPLSDFLSDRDRRHPHPAHRQQRTRHILAILKPGPAPAGSKGRIIADFAFCPFLCAPCSAPPICFCC